MAFTQGFGPNQDASGPAKVENMVNQKQNDQPTVDSVKQERNSLQKRRELTGVVVSDKMQKTIVVRVSRQVRDPLYKKYVEMNRRYKVHDEKNEAKTGDRVVLIESRPLSREKRWVLQSIIRRAGQAPEAKV